MLRAEAVVPMQRALVEQAQRGDLAAFTQLVEAVGPRLNGLANVILRDPEQAQDAVQDALLSAWRDLKALRDPDAFEAWLRRLTVHACYKVGRKDRRRRQVELHVPPTTASVSVPDASAHVADRDWILDALVDLSLEQRAVITLHYYLDLPVSEVAEILDIPYGTAASRLHRGLEAMRNSLHAPPSVVGGPAQEPSA
jgi:RNA polymerase sigma-70 factor (ECF subfamily)